MILIMVILAVAAVGLVIYAVFGVPCVQSASQIQKPKPEEPSPRPDPGKEQKIRRLEAQLNELDIRFKESKEQYAKDESEFMQAKEQIVKLTEELKRRDDWLAKAEAELAKIKSENSELSNKFINKEKELEKEFTNNVNLTRSINEIKSTLADKEMGCRLKEDQIQAQKHQIEDQLKQIKQQSATIAELKNKEKISEWVPKEEFNKLNEEYSQLEKELESGQERLKSFAEEIAHLRQEANRKAQPPEVRPEGLKEPEPEQEAAKSEPGKGSDAPGKSLEVHPQHEALTSQPDGQAEKQEEPKPEEKEAGEAGEPGEDAGLQPEPEAAVQEIKPEDADTPVEDAPGPAAEKVEINPHDNKTEEDNLDQKTSQEKKEEE